MIKYIIKANKHYSTFLGFIPHFGFTFQDRVSFEGKFDPSCAYDINTSDVWDINKFYGISTSYSHHVQSARLGWRCVDDKNIELVTYCYDKKVRIKEEVLDIITTNQKFKCTIIVEEDGFRFLYPSGLSFSKAIT